MSQVAALPSPMRRQVESKIESRKALPKQPPVQAEVRYLGSRDPRFRETNLKRMLRLAAVKSGQESLADPSGESISISQFENLPLEVQLQVANNDACRLGYLLPAKSTEDRRKASSPVGVKSTRSTKTAPASMKASSPGVETFARSGATFDESESLRYEKSESATDESTHIGASRSFFHDNILPLTLFMDENPDVGREAVEYVKDFLRLVTKEKRLFDVVRLLRAVRNHGDGWGSSDKFASILQAVNHAVKETHGFRLDCDRLFPNE
jgi:hypothetical protein